MMSIKLFNQIINELQDTYKLSWADSKLVLEMVLSVETWKNDDKLRLECFQFAQRLKNS